MQYMRQKRLDQTGLTPTESGRQESGRLAYLDGLRGVAILLVISYHYFSRFASHPARPYPYDSFWAGNLLFVNGHYGVQLFFAISGFVIALTLVRSRTPAEFFVRRLARLLPAMMVCSVLTLLFINHYPDYFNASLQDLLPSWTFIDGDVWEWIFPGTKFEWIDGAYWSLFVEVRFYLIACLVYFLFKDRFLEALTFVTFLSSFLHASLGFFQLRRYAEIFSWIFLSGYMPWFLLGASAYAVHIGRIRLGLVMAGVSELIIVAASVKGHSLSAVFVSFALLGLFVAIRRWRFIEKLVSASMLRVVGVASYSLYLLHQNIGVTLIGVIGRRFELDIFAGTILALCVALLMIFASQLVWKCWEVPANRRIVSAYAARLVMGGETRGGAR